MEPATAGVLVEAFPRMGGTPYQVARRANATPHHPFWSRNGLELFYIPGQLQFAVVNVMAQPSFSVSNPVSLPQPGFLEGGPDALRNIDIVDDQTFIGVINAELTKSGGVPAPRIRVVLNWFEQLRRNVPAR